MHFGKVEPGRFSRARRGAAAVAFVSVLGLGGCSQEPRPAAGEATGTSAQPLSRAFAAGSLVIPMDTTYQDLGTLKAFGLVYSLLRNDVPVHLVVLPGKPQGGVDFAASGKDLRTNAAITSHGYRAGPFVIDAADRAAALPVIASWQAGNTTAVHDMTAGFSADVRRTLVAAPRIAVFVDGNEIIAFRYLNAAGIPDSTGKAWPLAKDNAGAYGSFPDVLDPVEIRGAAAGGAPDGALLRSDGTPNWCQVTSMHYADPADEEAVREMRAWLAASPVTHAFMECHATTTFEDATNGKLLSTGGVVKSTASTPVVNRVPDSPFAQYDGTFTPVGGSVPALALAAGSRFYASDVVLINGAPTTSTGIVWMTGNLDGDTSKGKVSYLGGHEYPTKLPISANPQTNGVRLFLDSLFESGCAASTSQPQLTLTKSGPASVSGTTVTYSLTYNNAGPGIADAAVLTDAVPAGTTFVSASGGGTASAGVVTWNLGNLVPGASGSVTVTVSLPGDGSFSNQAKLAYNVSLTPKQIVSNTVATVRATPAPATSDLSVTMTDSPDPVAGGAAVTYTIDVANAGPDFSGLVTVTDAIPSGATFVSATGTGWTCGVSNGVVTCTRPQAAVGASPTLAIVVTAPAGPASLTNTASVSSTTADPATANNSVTTTTTVVGTASGADLSIAVTATPDPVASGGAISYVVQVTNAGPSPASGVTVTNALSAGATLVSATGNGWSCTQSGSIVTCVAGTLSTGTAPALTLIVTAPAGPAVVTATTVVSSAVSDPAPANNNSLTTTTVSATGDAGVDGGSGDTDGDGLSDAVERTIGTNPNDADSDDDGVPDGQEPSFAVDTDGDGLINALDPDSDNDGLFDGTEMGKGCAGPGTNAAAGHCISDGDAGVTKTNPLNADTDGGGARDGSEDANRNGVVDTGERDPTVGHAADDNGLDSDGDGLSDALERSIGSDPNDADSDDDGVLDGQESNFADDTDGDGLINVLDPDSDDDGLFDGTELGKGCASAATNLAKKTCVPDGDSGATTTSPLARDTDRGGASDGSEDANRNGVVDTGERNPTAGNGGDDAGTLDTDKDGLSDKLEQTLGSDPNDADTDDDGLLDGQEPNPGIDSDGDGLINVLDPDSDDDGLYDGTERGRDCSNPATNRAKHHCTPDADPTTMTGPLSRDTDKGGVSDGSEDANLDGKKDAGESDPTTGHGADDGSVADADKDGLSDALERFVGSNPNDADSDDDGVVDGREANPADDTDGDGLRNVLDVDSDDDGLFDGTEVGNGCSDPATDVSKKHCTADADPATKTSPVTRDTDGGGASDGAEDANLNGRLDAGEQDPTAGHGDDDDDILDSDKDGLSDALEKTIGSDANDRDSDDDGLLDGQEANPSDDTDGDGKRNVVDSDSDADGLFDGTEAGKDCGDAATDRAKGQCIADADPSSTTGVLDPDSDDGGVKDGDEDANHNGKVDSGERDPNNGSDDKNVPCVGAECLDAGPNPDPDAGTGADGGGSLFDDGGSLEGGGCDCATSVGRKGTSQAPFGMAGIALVGAAALRRRRRTAPRRSEEV